MHFTARSPPPRPATDAHTARGPSASYCGSMTTPMEPIKENNDGLPSSTKKAGSPEGNPAENNYTKKILVDEVQLEGEHALVTRKASSSIRICRVIAVLGHSLGVLIQLVRSH